MESPRLVAVLVLFVAALATAAAADDDAQLLDQFKEAVPTQPKLRGWSAADGACRFPGAVCRSGRLTSLSLAGVLLNADFRAVATTLLQLGGLEALSLRGANVEALAAACAGLRALNLSGDGVGAPKSGGTGGGGSGSGSGFAELDTLDLSSNKISGDADLRWMVGAGVGAVRRLDLSGNKISGALPEFTDCSGLEYLDLSGNLIDGERWLAGPYPTAEV